MLRTLINKEVIITYQMGYSYATKRGVITKVNADFITINNNMLINSKMIIKVIIKEK
ncbi:MAG: hypothetical protein PHF21_00475 [Bacilli bacterium]|nr:hypothetical protein [Bacilli bacterium]